MTVSENISEKVNELLKIYDFNKDTLAKYLDLSPTQIDDIANGNVECLLRKQTAHTVIDKIMFLYVITIEDADTKTSAFLEVLVSYHHLSTTTIAKMADVETSDIEKMISNSFSEVAIEAKYKIAVTTMSLRFFLKSCEPNIEND